MPRFEKAPKLADVDLSQSLSKKEYLKIIEEKQAYIHNLHHEMYRRRRQALAWRFLGAALANECASGCASKAGVGNNYQLAARRNKDASLCARITPDWTVCCLMVSQICG